MPGHFHFGNGEQEKLFTWLLAGTGGCTSAVLTGRDHRELLPWSIPVTIVRAGKMRTSALPKAARNQQALIDSLTPEQEAPYKEADRRIAHLMGVL